MSGDRAPVPVDMVENPLSGERIRILRRDGGWDANALVWELILAPGGRVPSSHSHPHQHERFTVLDGELHFRLGCRRLRLRRGESVTVPPGRVHHFANRGRLATTVQVETVPALGMEAMLKTAATMAQDQYRSHKQLPRLVDLALFMDDFETEVSSPLAAGVVAVAVRYVARLTRFVGRDRRYRRLREAAGPRTLRVGV
jgi:quercetin dioxygenase-like cupin family protein